MKRLCLSFALSLVGIGSVVNCFAPAFAQTSTPIDPDPNRIAVLWHEMSGTPYPVEEFVRQNGPYRQAVEIDREAVFAREVALINTDIASINPLNDTYVIRISSTLTQYDPRAGGFFLPLFSGRSFVPIKNGASMIRYDTRALARGILAGTYNLMFLNPEDYVLWKMPENEARAIMSKFGSQPRLMAEFHYRPIAATPKHYLDSVGGDVHGVVTKVMLKDQRGAIVLERGLKTTQAEAQQIFAQARFKPDSMTQSMVFHKIVEGPEPNWERYLQTNANSQTRRMFSDEDRISYTKDYYDALDPTQPFVMLVAAKFSGYDPAEGRFALRIDQPIKITSQYPYAMYDYRAAAYEQEKQKAGRFRMVKEPTGTSFAIRYNNAGDIAGLDMDPAEAARFRADPSRDIKASALLTVQPISVDIVESADGRSTQAYLNTRIAKARIFESRTGQMLIERDFGINPPADVRVNQEREALGDFDGLDPYTIDFRNIKLGMTEAQMRAASKEYFREVRTSPKFAPGYMKLFGNNESLGVTFCTDDRICALRHIRKWKENRVSDIYQATIDKYGPVVGGRRPYDPMGRGREMEASMEWTKNYRSRGGVKGNITFFRGDKTTTLFMDAVDKGKQRKKREKEKISLD